MKLVIITGPHAVGKMTVGQELCKITGLRLFHNHMTIDVVAGLFDNLPKERERLTNLFRHEIFDAYSKSDEYGMVFTYMWAFDSQNDWDYMGEVEALFTSRGAQVYFVELAADYDLRIERNKTENRLLHKSTKRDLDTSEMLFRKLEEKYRLNSLDGEVTKEHYLKIHNDEMAPEAAAAMIKEAFDL
ncbi:MAG: AAA family ATPase [Clostridiales bacterium]|nr:AAA family ATPase [Clostridiales bacterium]